MFISPWEIVEVQGNDEVMELLFLADAAADREFVEAALLRVA